jgi:hypothetical protein
MRKVLAVLGVLSAMACGSDKSTGPKNDFPDVGGVWQVTGSFDQDPSETFSGTMTLVQADRTTGTLTGSIDMTLVSGDNLSGTATSAMIDKAGNLTVVVTDSESGTSASWTFTGTVSGHSVTGRHTLTDGTQTFTGPWTGTHS